MAKDKYAYPKQELRKLIHDVESNVDKIKVHSDEALLVFFMQNVKDKLEKINKIAKNTKKILLDICIMLVDS